MRTVGVDNLLISRKDLGEQLVYQLTKGFFEVLPEIAKTLKAAEVDADRPRRHRFPFTPALPATIESESC